MGEEAKNAEPVIGVDDDDAVLRQTLAVVSRLVTRPGCEAAAVEPQINGQLVGGGFRGCPNSDREAVLTDVPVAKDDIAKNLALNAARPEVDGLAYAGPRLNRLRRAPAVPAFGWRAKRNTT